MASHWSWSSLILLDCGQWASGIILSVSWALGHECLAFYVGAGVMTSGLQARKTSTLLTEPSPALVPFKSFLAERPQNPFLKQSLASRALFRKWFWRHPSQDSPQRVPPGLGSASFYPLSLVKRAVFPLFKGGRKLRIWVESSSCQVEQPRCETKYTRISSCALSAEGVCKTLDTQDSPFQGPLASVLVLFLFYYFFFCIFGGHRGP